MHQKILVIHPEDKSTDFLSEIYSDINCTLIRDNKTCDKDIVEHIKNHDRIMMMGHGCGSGLFRIGGTGPGLMINKSHVPLLKEKTNNVYIWCNADVFVVANKLKGFYTGMIISELMEALYCKIIPKYLGEAKQSNELFSASIKEYINMEPQLICENVKRKYNSEQNMIIQYNQKNIYFAL